jgi:hypothetical protein
MNDKGIITIVRWIRRLMMDHSTGLKKAFIKGLTLRLEDAGVSELDLDRLKL